MIAALLDLKQAKMIFTSNFDDVIETGYSEVAGKNLATFHLAEPSAALDALNAEQFPIYAKIHGDFRYQSIKNLPQDLLENDEKIKTCFLAGATRYGLVVSGYSGRDENVMRMLSQALDQNNPFPQGLFWTVTQISDVTEAVKNLIKKAREKGVKAHIIEMGTFDILMSKIWRQLPNRTDHLNNRVRPALAKKVSISLPKAGAGFPMLRTNALPIVSCGADCARIELLEAISYADMKKASWEKEAKVIITKPDQHVLAWGAEDQIRKIFNPQSIKSLQKHTIEDPASQISQSTFMKSFYEEALINALVKDKPLLLRSHYNNHTLIVDNKAVNNPVFQPLKEALANKGTPGYIIGSVPSKPGITWAEAVKVKLEERNGKLWLLLTPDIWIFPPDERRNCKDFLRSKKLYRYNKQSFELLDAWIKILFSSIGDSVAQIECFATDSFSVKFEINTRTAYSQKEAVNVR